MKVFGFLLVTLLFVSAAYCQDAIRTSSENFIIIIDTLSLLLLLITAFFGWELYRMMRGGQLARSWGFITVGIIAFSFGKIAEVGHAAELWLMPLWLPNVVNLMVALMLISGMFSQRKTLS